MKGLRTLLVVALALALTVGAHAISFVTSRPALGSNDFVDWATLGPYGTVVSNPFTTSSNGGLSMTVSKPTSGPFERRDQSTGWWGNFAPGDALLWTRDEVGPMEIVFANPVLGAGAQIQRDAYGSFVGKIKAYDSMNNLLGSFSLSGNSTSSADNSAIFLGVKDTSAVIKKLVFDVDNTNGDFAINRLDLVVQGGAPVIPEPGTLMLMSIGGLAIGLGRRLRR